ncbi:MAG TPA: mannitol dehydrogenase family protein [Candidatus Ligilactobacillus excrementavium]|nr:mannitol dehydrogenase family protein [Candidatus Ligilactobacillus excrementavium]
MVSLTDNYIDDPELFSKAGLATPKYAQSDIVKSASNDPIWVHFGGGNLFRCFHAKIAQDLLNINDLKSGIIVAETFDKEVIDQIYDPYKNRMLSVILKDDAKPEKELIASVADAIFVDKNSTKEWDKLTKIFSNPSLQFVTFSITEKGYSLSDVNGNLTSSAKEDIIHGPNKPTTTMAIVASLLYARYQAGRYPIAMVSTDNFSQNGLKLKTEVLKIAEGWANKDLVNKDFIKYLNNTEKVSFPLSMIDRITPSPAKNVANSLSEDGFEDTKILTTQKQTVIAPFANTEEVKYLVIEDNFPNGRPDLDKAGVILTDRQTVNDADQMKVTACLNPLHTALAIFGCLLNFTSISDEMKDNDLLGLIKNLGYGEDLPVVKDPKIIDPEDFIAELINKRLPNKNIPDTPQRIAVDTSQVIPIRYGVTIQHYIDDPKREPEQLEFIPLILAGWCRYLIGIDDNGQTFKQSPDPLLSTMTQYVSDVKLNDMSINIHEVLKPILSNESIFGNDLYKIGLGAKVENYFKLLIAGKGAVRKTLHETVKNKSYDFI